MNEPVRYLDITQITAESPLVKSIISLHKKCRLKHKEGCFAETCEECLARTFNGYHNHILPLVTAPGQVCPKNVQGVGERTRGRAL